ncbi:fumarylacetoacetate hydrolase family protein [Lampropedia puyangensis]|uniref:Fumarylacetoacetate hydrolase family protein n=1 Tax=Lampropedia puyangensis TaxID=1330072 RepID=A0A4S8FDH8_9BURK|nr:fumarylacetoacetate hydrolase family protein [Lampropedia puyangensis]THU05045.1 fumarylacetoacetate hydrolase family protein [Lampropedia puyangensis]
MKILSFQYQGTPAWGALNADGQSVTDLSAMLPQYPTALAWLEAGAKAHQAALDALLQPAGTVVVRQLNEVTLDIPVTQPRKIFCIGVNYAHRNAEYKDGSNLPKYPSIFVRFPSSFVGHGQALLQPPESQQLDYEGEIALVIGQGGRRIPQAHALSHVAAITCVNEGTIRDWVHHAKFNVTQGKNWAASGSIGPWMTTVDEYTKGLDDLRVQTRVNGELRQDDSTTNLMFDFAYLIHYLSTFTELEPGDIIVTGTPIGAGIRFDPPKFLQPGDVVEVEVTGVGVLSNRVEQES